MKIHTTMKHAKFIETRALKAEHVTLFFCWSSTTILTKVVAFFSFPCSVFHPPTAAGSITTVNSTLATDDPAALLAALQSEHAHLEGIQEPQAPHYLTLLKAALAAKQGEELSGEEIQAVLEKANAQTVEAAECEFNVLYN